MEAETQGAWLIHHSSKLEQFTNSGQYENILDAGKCGKLLSALSESENDSELPMEKVKAIAKASNIRRAELPTYLDELEDKRLIRVYDSGVEVLAVTSKTILNYTSTIFTEYEPSSKELAVIELAEKASENPILHKEASEYLGDTYRMSSAEMEDMFARAELYGFTDAEAMDSGEKLYFNGNLFRTNDATKLNAVISTLKPGDRRSINDLDALLESKGCISYKKACEILGKDLFDKLQSIGVYDVNEVSNDASTSYFVTKPAAFGRYGNPFVDDALDLAKALVTSLYYGMHYSSPGRGRIVALEALMRKLIWGNLVGPATAIGQDYKILEFKRVVEIIPEKDGWGRFYMRLLKKDVGEIALKVLQQGGASEDVLLKGANVNKYSGPEVNREITRKKQAPIDRTDVVNTLRTLRM